MCTSKSVCWGLEFGLFEVMILDLRGKGELGQGLELRTGHF